MSSSRRSRPKPSTKAQLEIAAGEVLAWLSDCIQGGLCFVSQGIVIFENAQFGELVEAPRPGLDCSLRTDLLDQAMAWNRGPLGTRDATEYHLTDRQGDPLTYECRFNVVPYRSDKGVLMVLEDVTERTLLSQEASQVAKFQSVLARIGSLAVSGTPVQEIMNEAVCLTAQALRAELCKILIPRESDEHLYLVAGVGWREGLIGTLTVEGGTHSQAGFAIRERQPVVVEDLHAETRFVPSKLLSEHGGIAGMSVPMMVQDRVYGVMGAHCKSVRHFAPKELEFLCLVANTVATVLERWRREETQLQLYHRMFELVQDGVMLTDTRGTLLDWNPAMERLTGWTQNEVIGRTPALLKSGKHPPEFFERMWQTIRSGLAFVDRVVNRRKDGSEFLAWESVSPVKDPDGTIRYYLAILTDLSEREQMLEALRHTEQVKLVGQLAGGILHEVRNPLIGLGSLATHLADQATLPQDARDRCRLIAREAARIDDLLESHLEQLRPRPFETAPCDLSALLDDTLTLLHPNILKHRVSVRKHVAADLPSVEVSRTHMLQVCLNIAMNAIDAMPNGGELTMTVRPETRRVPGLLMTFADSGKGISPEDLQRIYEPFFTSGKAKGVGLGLTITRDMIERHSGQLLIHSPPGSGAIVDVWLPLKRED
ncbi:MAG: PAS domain S-box protein [Nitrospira sp.]|nr:PAS domain S-box protein [Nitrospira sp.]MDH4328122.1 PAS domain S-box protein [Nitrospira sp.]